MTNTRDENGPMIYEEDVKGGDGADTPQTGSGYESPTSSGDVGVPENPPLPADPRNN